MAISLGRLTLFSDKPIYSQEKVHEKSPFSSRRRLAACAVVAGSGGPRRPGSWWWNGALDLAGPGENGDFMGFEWDYSHSLMGFNGIYWDLRGFSGLILW